MIPVIHSKMREATTKETVAMRVMIPTTIPMNPWNWGMEVVLA
jgi:hypothetical protein